MAFAGSKGDGRRPRGRSRRRGSRTARSRVARGRGRSSPRCVSSGSEVARARRTRTSPRIGCGRERSAGSFRFHAMKLYDGRRRTSARRRRWNAGSAASRRVLVGAEADEVRLAVDEARQRRGRVARTRRRRRSARRSEAGSETASSGTRRAATSSIRLAGLEGRDPVGAAGEVRRHLVERGGVRRHRVRGHDLEVEPIFGIALR